VVFFSIFSLIDVGPGVQDNQDALQLLNTPTAIGCCNGVANISLQKRFSSMAFHVICFYDHIEYVSDSIGVLASVSYGSDRCSVLVLTGVFKFLLLSVRDASGMIGSLGTAGSYLELSGASGMT
jgi:hypothetical protein